ncbi:hypothetical protein HQ576_13045, partial [bacterium]|nr:hypothetical protein [bacterium]
YFAWFLSAAAALTIVAGADAGAPVARPDYDAAFVRMAVPDKVEAHEVFAVKITMRNTGTKPWRGWPVRLRPVNPLNHLDWGTNYILIAQGKSVEAGEEYTFTSHLRAPAKPGKVGYQWQVCRDGTLWFGAATPAKTIEVIARRSEAIAETTVPERTSDGRKVLSWGDFEYVGSFKAPRTVGKARGAFSETGLALRPMADGRDRLFMNYTHPAQALFEVEVPVLVKVADGNHAALNTGEVKKVWGSLKTSKPGGQAIHPNGGFVWIKETQTLLWTWYHGYKAGSVPPVLGATQLTEDGKMTHYGPWYLSAPSRLYKAYWGGVLSLPKTFADQYSGGKTLALGFGGYYSICGPTSRGPALGAIPEPDPAKSSVPVLEMLYHPHDSPAPREGNYFNANCGFWSDQPESPAKGTWTYDDWCRAGAFVDAPAGKAYVAFVRLGTGRLGYDFGTITSAGASQYWYFYDPRSLGEAAKGERKPWQVEPNSVTKVNYPLGRTVTGACYDARTRRLYLCVTWAYPNGRESYPVVHVYRVR